MCKSSFHSEPMKIVYFFSSQLFHSNRMVFSPRGENGTPYGLRIEIYYIFGPAR